MLSFSCSCVIDLLVVAPVLVLVNQLALVTLHGGFLQVCVSHKLDSLVRIDHCRPSYALIVNFRLP